MNKHIRPYLLQFAVPCNTNPFTVKDAVRYREDKDMLYATDGDRPVIEMEKLTGPVTKKADHEKGEDQKDRRIW